MQVRLEPLVQVIRVYESGRDFPDPYVWAATCRFIDQETVEILGVVKAPGKGVWKAVLAELAQTGVETVVIKRRKNGDERTKRIRTAKSRNTEKHG